jgi:hypothetical protein
MPDTFRFLVGSPRSSPSGAARRNKTFLGQFSYAALARLKPGMTVAQATADVARSLALQRPPFRAGAKCSARLGPIINPLKRI